MVTPQRWTTMSSNDFSDLSSSTSCNTLNRVQFETRRFQFRSSPPWATLEGWYYGFQTGRGLASDFISNNELPTLLEERKQGLTVFWIPISAALYQRTALAQIQAASDPSLPLD